VIDSNGAPIPGVNILIKDSAKAVATDVDGKYSFASIPNGVVSLVASFIGFKSLEFKVTINGSTIQNITMIDDANVLDDVVVTGVVNPKSRLESSVSVSSIGT
jgi:hypothetical protein